MIPIHPRNNCNFSLVNSKYDSPCINIKISYIHHGIYSICFSIEPLVLYPLTCEDLFMMMFPMELFHKTNHHALL